MDIHSLCLQKQKVKPRPLGLRGEENSLFFLKRGVGESWYPPTRRRQIFLELLKGGFMATEEVYRNRKIQRLVRFSKEENDYLKDKIERSPFNNFQNYARILLLTGEVKMVDYSELQRLNGEVNRIGNNINQIAKLAHQFKEISGEDINDLSQQLSEIQAMISERFKEELKQERLI